MTAVAVVRTARRRPRRRLLLVWAGLAAATVAAFLARVLLGDFTFTVPDATRIVLGEEIPGASFILMETKLPRAVLAVLVGVALGTAGAIFQGSLRNPLASPDIIGVAMGASAAAVFGIVELGHQGDAVALWAAGGAVAMGLLVRLVGGTGSRLVLVGVGATVALQAVVQYLFTRADEYDAHLELAERERLVAAYRARAARSHGSRAALARLTPQEAAVLRHLMAGRAVKEIARLRVVSEATVRAQVKAVLAKLQVSSQLAAVAAAREGGWVEAPLLAAG